MTETKNSVTFQGNPLTLEGRPVEVGALAPDFKALDTSLQPVGLSSFKDKINLILSVPSLDTHVCDLEARRFNEEAGKLGADLKILVISMDLPFAQKRWADDRGAKNLVLLSDHRSAEFGTTYGVLIKELRLLARAVFVVDKKGEVRYKELVGELTNEPNYAQALQAAKALL